MFDDLSIDQVEGQMNLVDEVERAAAGDDQLRADMTKEWIGLPAFGENEIPPRVTVAFDSEEDRDRFLEHIGIKTIHKAHQGKSSRTISTWWPDRARQDLKSLRFVVEEID